jgi:hypothetical protein
MQNLYMQSEMICEYTPISIKVVAAESDKQQAKTPANNFLISWRFGTTLKE